jgi:hypothetical protein
MQVVARRAGAATERLTSAGCHASFAWLAAQWQVDYKLARAVGVANGLWHRGAGIRGVVT